MAASGDADGVRVMAASGEAGLPAAGGVMRLRAVASSPNRPQAFLLWAPLPPAFYGRLLFDFRSALSFTAAAALIRSFFMV